MRSLREDRLAFGSTLERELAYPPERWADYVQRGAHAPNQCTWVVERADGGLGGLVGGFQTPDGAIHVYAMWVEPALRGHGFAGQMLDRLLAWAGTVDPNARVVLSVNPTQTAALRLYLSRGFVATGVVEPLGHTPGVVVQEMQRVPVPRGNSPPPG